MRDKNIEDSLKDWIDNFSTFSIYQILFSLIKLWELNIKTKEMLKNVIPTERPMTIPLFLLREVELGLSISDYIY